MRIALRMKTLYAIVIPAVWLLAVAFTVYADAGHFFDVANNKSKIAFGRAEQLQQLSGTIEPSNASLFRSIGFTIAAIAAAMFWSVTLDRYNGTLPFGNAIYASSLALALCLMAAIIMPQISAVYTVSCLRELSKTMLSSGLFNSGRSDSRRLLCRNASAYR